MQDPPLAVGNPTIYIRQNKYGKTSNAKSVSKSASEVKDPTVFINDRNGITPLEMLLGAPACGLTKEAKQLQVPLSCMQLALYNIMVVDSVSQAFRHKPMSQKSNAYGSATSRSNTSEESCPEHKLVIDDVL